MVVAYAGEENQGRTQPKDSNPQFPLSQPSASPPAQQAPTTPAPPQPQPRPSGPLQTLEGGFNVVRGDITKTGGFVAGEVETGVAGYEKITQPIRNVTQGPQQGTPARYETVTTYKQGGPGAGLVPVESQVLVSPAQGPTNQQRAREGAFLAAGIVPGGDLLVVGEKAGAGVLADIGSRFAIGSAYGGASSALKGGNPEQIGESAVLSGGFLAAGPLAGRAGAALSSKFGDIGAALRSPSTVEEPTGTYSGTIGGKPGITNKFGDIFNRPPATPGQQLTDIPGGEAPISTRQFGEVYAQSKFGISPTPGVSYEFEYGTNRPFQYSAAESRQSDFQPSGPAGPGYQGGGGGRGGQVFEQETSLRTPPGSPFSETQFRSSLFQNAGEDVTPGFAAGLGIGQQSASSSALKTILPPLSNYKTVSGQGSASTQGFQQGQQQGSGIKTTQGSSGFQTYVQTTQQQTQQQNQQPQPDVTVFRALANPASVSAFPSSEGRPFSAGFAQPPSLGVEKRRRKAIFGSREIHYPIGSLFDFSAVKGQKRRGKRK